MEQMSSAGPWGLRHCCPVTDVPAAQLQRPSEDEAWERGRLAWRARPGSEGPLSHWTLKRGGFPETRSRHPPPPPTSASE